MTPFGLSVPKLTFKLVNGSTIVTLVKVTFPVLVIVKVYSTGSPSVLTSDLSATFSSRIDGI